MAETTLFAELSSLGLSSEESKVYLALLELGRGYVSAIAKRSGVQRVNCYHLLDKLAAHGMITKTEHHGKKMFSTESPEVLVKHQLAKLRVAEKILPDLKQLMRAKPQGVRIRHIEGETGIKSLLDDTLSSADEIVGYTNLDALQRLLHEYLHFYSEERMRRRIRARFLSPFTPRSGKFLDTYYPTDKNRELNEIVFVDPGEFRFENEVYIYGDSVATFSVTPPQLIGVIVESPLFSQTYRSMFNLSWLGATSFISHR